MPYAAVFTLLAACLGLWAVSLGGWALALLWPAVSFLHLALAYAFAKPTLLGKRPDGRFAWWSWLTFGPVFLLLWTIWRLQRLLSREAPSHEVAPGLWLGRRPSVREIPGDVVLVVDLAAEFPGVMIGREYLLLPTLDGIAPEGAAFRAAVARVAGCCSPVLVHCAMGHGRSATLAAAVLLARGLVRDARQAEARLREVRPGVRLKPGQRRLLRELEPGETRRAQFEGPRGETD